MVCLLALLLVVVPGQLSISHSIIFPWISQTFKRLGDSAQEIQKLFIPRCGCFVFVTHSINSVVAFQLVLAIMKGILYSPRALQADDRAPHVMVECRDMIAVFADDDE